MFYLKCTAEVQKTLGLSKPAFTQAIPTDAALGNWYLNRFNIGRQNIFIFMNENTYLSFILYHGKKPVTAATLPNMMLAGIEQLLLMRGYSKTVVGKVLRSYQAGLFAKTDNRSVLGVLNDLMRCYRTMIEVAGGLNACDLTRIIMQMNAMPQRTLQWRNSWEAVQATLENV